MAKVQKNAPFFIFLCTDISSPLFILFPPESFIITHSLDVFLRKHFVRLRCKLTHSSCYRFVFDSIFSVGKYFVRMFHAHRICKPNRRTKYFRRKYRTNVTVSPVRKYRAKAIRKCSEEAKKSSRKFFLPPFFIIVCPQSRLMADCVGILIFCVHQLLPAYRLKGSSQFLFHFW